MKVLKFYAEWCGPCKSLTIALNNMRDKISIPIEEVDIDNNKEIAMHYGIRSVPTMVLIDDNNAEIRRRVGLLNETQITEFMST